MKKQLLIISLLVLQSFIIFIPSSAVAPEIPEGYIIEGDSVVWENNWARLEVYPHTSHEILTHVQYANLTWKLADNDIDVAFRFNSSISNGKIWKKSGNDWIPVNMYLTEYNDKYYYRHDNFHVVQDGFYQFKWQYSMPINTSGKWELLGKLSSDTIQEAYSSGRYIMLDPWWDSNWNFYKPITVDSGYIDASLQDFPLLVVVNNTIGSECDDGKSIRFLSTDDSTEFYYEIEGNWSSTGNSYVWVNISEQIPSGSDYIFLMYYNNSGASDNQNSTNVWNNNYKMVLHMNGTGDYKNITDSTSNDVDAISENGGPGYQGVGIAGYCVDFEVDNSEWLRFGALGDYNLWTFEIWHNYESWITSGISGTEKYYSFGASTGGSGYRTWGTGDGVGWNGAIEVTPATYTVDTWYYNILTCDGSGIEAFIDTVSQGTDATAPDNLNVANFKLAAKEGAADVFDGKIDEVRVSNVVRNASWIKASFHTINQTTGFMTFGAKQTSKQVITNATTGMELTNATLRGYIDNKFTGNYNYGFWIGQSTPVDESNADQNVTGAGTITAPNNFSYNVSSLSKGTHYYVRAWVKNGTSFTSTSVYNEVDFYTKCDAPTGFTATASGCNVELAWTKGTGADKTTIVRKVDSYPTSTTDGTVIYNNTDSSYSDTTGAGSHQYYRAWSWAGDKHSDGNASTNLLIPPCPPTNVDGEILTNKTLNISWTRGTGANTTVIVRKIGSSPGSVTDGTEIYNNTGTHFIETDLTQDYFYRLWSWANGTYSSSVAFGYGALVVSCYDEETNGSLYFDVFISNQSGSETYESKNNTNPHVVNVADLPIGEQISIRVSAASNYSEKTETFTGYSTTENTTVTYIVLLQEPESKALTNVTCTDASSGHNSYPAFTLDADVITILADAADNFTEITVNYTHYEYESRTYYRDLTTNHVFVLNAYLPSADDKLLCRITVIDEISQAVDDAYAEIKRNINGNWVTIASRYTDGNGQVDVFLVDGILYKFVISKTGYITEYSDWTPSEEVPIHTFKLYFEEEEPTPPYVEPEEITFNGYITSTTLYINYTDNLEETIDTIIYVYEINVTLGNESLLDSDSRTGDNSFQVSFSGINRNNTYIVILHYNHTTFGFQTRTLIFERRYIPTTTPEKIDVILDVIFGPSIFGWGNLLIWFFLVAGCYYADQRDAGKIMVLLGGIFLFLNVMIGFNTTLMTLAGGAIPVLFIVVGIIVMWNDSRKVTI